MKQKTIEKIISKERLNSYLKYHSNHFESAVAHYKANIEISESFYPMLSVLEIALRNNFDFQFKRRFNDDYWFENPDFIKIANNFQIDRIQKAKSKILRENRTMTAGKMIAELSFGFWTSFLDSKFEKILWKNLRFVFPNCPKSIRKRKTMSSKFNGIRKFRNRIFHHESVSWDYVVLVNYKKEISEGIAWLEKDLLKWCEDMFRFDAVMKKRKSLFRV